MKGLKVWTFAAAAAVMTVPQAAFAQISVTPTIGAYVPGGSFHDLRESVDEKYKRGATLGLGANINLGMLRGTIAYASGANISRDGISGTADVGDGSVLAVAADIVLRPLPNIILVQPYVLGGAGYKRDTYSFDDEGLPDDLESDENQFVLHLGVGADISLGGLGLIVEVTDFIGRDNNDKWKVHDAFGMVGLRIGL